MNKLIDLRNELNVPKNQYNSFGKYNYRSQEDILEAVKPLLKQYDLLLTISDEIIPILDRVYVKATVTLLDNDKVIATSTGFAREPLVQKGMNEAQITGSVSSYARKYALNAMFLIDDTKDPDTEAHHKQTTQPEKNQEKKAPEFNRNDAIKITDKLLSDLKAPEEYISNVQKEYSKCKTQADFTTIQNTIKGDSKNE